MSFVVIVALVGLGIWWADHPVASPPDDAFTTTTPAVVRTTGGGSSSSSADGGQLLALLPASIADSCSATGARPGGIENSLVCRPSGGDDPDRVIVQAYATVSAMNAEFTRLAGSLPTGDCSTGQGYRSTWRFAGRSQGPLACYLSESRQNTVVWGSTRRAVLVEADDATWTADDIYTWWVHATWLS